MVSERRIRVLVVDDHQVVRLGLRALFATVGHFEVVGEAGSAAEAVEQARRTCPDMVVMDVRLPDGSGVEACREIRSARPETRVVMLTSYSDEEAVVASILAGASGYLLKDSQAERLIETVEVAARGDSLLDPAATKAVIAWMRRIGGRGAADPLGVLSEQERRILPLLAEGRTNREIARELFLSEQTVKTYVSHILRKLQLARRAEAAAYLARLRAGAEGSAAPTGAWSVRAW